MSDQEGLKDIPSVDAVVHHLEERGLGEGRPRPLVVRAVRAAVAEARASLLNTDPGEHAPGDVKERVLLAAERAVEAMAGDVLRPVVNATGVIVHTNLGRAPLSADAVERISETARGYSNLEYEVGEGKRGKRDGYVREALCELTGAEDALVTNNNAAAVLLALNTLALGREVVVSRGELIEIGGSFRLPDVFERSGARMVPVGTTNRTHASDYETAVCNRTAALMAAHWSNYSIVGFVERVQLRDLASICERHGLPLIHDLGSGILSDPASLGLDGEMTLTESLDCGASVVTASGDKILGGPQAGIALGERDVVGAMRANPLMRALRPGKLTLAALQATLEHYLNGSAETDVPVLRALVAKPAALRERAERLLGDLGARCGGSCACEIVETVSRVGGGAAPERAVPSVGLALHPAAMSAEALALALRSGDPPVVARTAEGRVVLDVRTVLPEQDQILLDGVCAALRSER
ncbi:MAG: L-seryl-tRNA(Sec) selenium transferase [Candidatus Eisenbacteria bacterium]